MLRRIADRGDDGVWISRFTEAALLARADELEALGAAGGELPPLYGVPFAVKDNIDVAGLPTTAACPAFARTPGRPRGQRPAAAGCRGHRRRQDQPRPVRHRADRRPLAVRGVRERVRRRPDRGRFELGQRGRRRRRAGRVRPRHRHRGSGRVPAAMNGIVGLKPTRGLVGTSGVVPACRSLDCVSVFTADLDDAADVLAVLAGARPRRPVVATRSRPARPPGRRPAGARRGGRPGLRGRRGVGSRVRGRRRTRGRPCRLGRPHAARAVGRSRGPALRRPVGGRAVGRAGRLPRRPPRRRAAGDPRGHRARPGLRRRRHLSRPAPPAGAARGVRPALGTRRRAAAPHRADDVHPCRDRRGARGPQPGPRPLHAVRQPARPGRRRRARRGPPPTDGRSASPCSAPPSPRTACSPPRTS